MKPFKCFSRNYSVVNKRFAANFSNCLSKHDPVSVHRLRVSIKKIKAFFHLLEYVNHDFDAAKSFHFYKKIFKQAGKMRELQVQVQLLTNLDKELKTSLLERQSEVIEKEKKEYRSFKKYCRKAKPGFNDKVNKQVLYAIEKDFSVVRAQEYLLVQLNQITKHMRQYKQNYNDLHKIRILLKDYLYNIVMVNDCVLNNKIIAKHISEINVLQNLIGKWHDEVALLNFASGYKYKMHFSQSDKKAMRLLQSRLQKSTKQTAISLRKHFPSLLEDFKIISQIL